MENAQERPIDHFKEKGKEVIGKLKNLMHFGENQKDFPPPPGYPPVPGEEQRQYPLD